jgi:hypothetical protein
MFTTLFMLFSAISDIVNPAVWEEAGVTKNSGTALGVEFSMILPTLSPDLLQETSPVKNTRVKAKKIRAVFIFSSCSA